MGFVMKPWEVVDFLEDQGFYWDRNSDHRIMTNGTISVPIPTGHSGDLKKGTLSGILREAGFTTKDAKKWREGR